MSIAQLDHDLYVRRLTDTLRAVAPYVQHLSNCALMTALPTARIGAFSCTCGVEARKRALDELTEDSQTLGLYDEPFRVDGGLDPDQAYTAAQLMGPNK